ncbi:MAG: D-alanyl-D-alanine carboxypeptidase, partial [Chitinophagaceae bacterium]
MSIRAIIVPVGYIFFLAACAAPVSVIKKVNPETLELQSLKSAHLGLSVYDVAEDKYLYNYQGDKYFVPASNTKIFTLYAGLKYLGDSLPGIGYEETADTLFIYPTGDPTLLHPDFSRQPVIQKLQQTNKTVVAIDNQWQEEAFGSGWSWDDYNDSYMPERSSLPVYGNVVKWIQVSQKTNQQELEDSMQTFVFSEPEVNWKVRFKEDTLNKTFFVKRKKEENYFEVSQGKERLKEQSVP